jgi:hypothetical protein
VRDHFACLIEMMNDLATLKRGFLSGKLTLFRDPKMIAIRQEGRELCFNHKLCQVFTSYSQRMNRVHCQPALSPCMAALLAWDQLLELVGARSNLKIVPNEWWCVRTAGEVSINNALMLIAIHNESCCTISPYNSSHLLHGDSRTIVHPWINRWAL